MAARRQGLSPQLRRLGTLSAAFRTGYADGYRTATGATRRARQRRHGGVYPNAAAATAIRRVATAIRRVAIPKADTATRTRAATATPAATATARRTRTALNDGYEKGREDARDRDSYDPLRHKWYREGDHDYKSAVRPAPAVRERLPSGVQGRLRPRLSGVEL